MRKTILLGCLLWVFLTGLCFITNPDQKIMGKSMEIDENPELSVTKQGIYSKNKNELDASITFKVKTEHGIEKMSMNEYLPGVLAAEMPASFPEEALRAQAVAARSFILYRIAHPSTDGVHDGVPLCTTPSHCKGYVDILDSAVAESRYGAAAVIYTEKLIQAVQDTDGEIMTYEGEPILAAFHAISGGMTENCVDIWGGNVPYLVAVESPGEEIAEKFSSMVEYEIAEYRKRLQSLCSPDTLGDDPTQYITKIERSAAGSVIRACVGDATVKGSAIRSVLGLNSADFTVEIHDGIVSIAVQGYGHGVGMSQYGARAMAMEGSDYVEILTHYYTGAVLSEIELNAVVKADNI